MALLALASGLCTLLAAPTGAAAARASSPRVLRVGTYHGIRGQYKTIQAAVDAARPGDWVLVAPGDYKTTLIPDRQRCGRDFAAGDPAARPRTSRCAG